jgi:hypothetical protein
VKSAWCALGLLCGSALAGLPARAGEAAADADLLEFLGSVDSTEEGWHDYLASTDVDQVARSASTPVAGAAPPDSASPPKPPPAPNVPRKVKQP